MVVHLTLIPRVKGSNPSPAQTSFVKTLIYIYSTSKYLGTAGVIINVVPSGRTALKLMKFPRVSKIMYCFHKCSDYWSAVIFKDNLTNGCRQSTISYGSRGPNDRNPDERGRMKRNGRIGGKLPLF